MTLCIGVQSKKTVRLYADTLYTTATGIEYASKISEVHGMVCAAAGDHAAWLSFFALTTPDRAAGVSFKNFYNAHFPNRVRLIAERTEGALELLVVSAGRLYVSEGHCIESPRKSYSAIGGGAETATAIMAYEDFDNRTERDQHKIVQDIFKTISSINPGVGGAVEYVVCREDGSWRKSFLKGDL